MIQTLALLGAGMLSSAADYAWPLSLEPQLTSSFAEYRAGRFHAGIDLRTAGVGREVYAAGDGYISRVRCSPEGYGKAVYLQLHDGNVAIYAHLADFYPELTAYVREHQHRRQSYTVDLYLKPSQFPVRKGQLVAFSGQTGIGAPHLHFEMRDASQAPVNPRLLGFDWPDSTPPRIDKILVAPRGLEGRVNGDVLPVTLAVRRNEQGQYRTDPVHVEGQIGLGADVTDPGSGGYNLGVHRLRLSVGGTEQFRMQHDRMSYTNHRNGVVSYHPHMMDQGRFLLLWRWPGNVCHSYAHSPEDGWVTVTPQTEEFIVEASDFYGNSVAVTVPVARGTLPPSTATATATAGVDMDVWGPELLLFAGADRGEPPTLRINGGASAPFTALAGSGYRAAFRPERSGLYQLSVTHPSLPEFTREVAAFIQGQPRTTLAIGGVEITAGPEAPYGALFLRAWEDANPPAHQLIPRSAAYRVWPGDVPIFDPITITFPLLDPASASPRVHVYRHRGAYWSREDTVHLNGRVTVETRTPGIFMALEDTTAPNFANVLPAENHVATSRRPEIGADVSDDASGITGFRITCGDTWLLTAYDPERNHIHWEQDHDLPPGPQTLTYTLTDAAGNTRSYTRTITIPG